MTKTKRGTNKMNPQGGDAKNAARDVRKPQFTQIGKATSQIVKDAAALLDEEIAGGIIAAKKMQQRFQKERRIDPADFADALRRFQNDGHEVVSLMNDQVAELRSQENNELITRLINNSHDLLDLAVGLVNMGVEVANQLAQANLPKSDAQPNQKRRR